ncbi:MAG: glycosyltransferase family 2 protein [Candidatus Moranbacteria bacterium]|nr:glycosyltransferase family 2 protein [Candidatus Moranbacteria bacterium]NTW75940.1 glycosyltransferase family 2 protein [Candidatus Moranbacteria bacterium]
MKYDHISVVIPCYREEEVIRNNIIEVHDYLLGQFSRHEIVVVTDGSPDRTPDIVESLKRDRPDIPLVHIRFDQNRGKGAAVKRGVFAATYDPILYLDADLTIPITELDEFMPAIRHADIVIASRLAPGAWLEEPTPWHRVIMARGFHLLQIFLLGNFEFSDTQCGFKLFRKPTARLLFEKLTIDRFAFDAELLFLARRYDRRVAILPVSVRKDPRNTNVRIIRDPLDMFLALLRIRFNAWSGRYPNAVFPHSKKYHSE